MSDFENAPKSYEYNASSETVYEQERPLRPARVKLASAITTSVLVLGGLAGGAAFAFTANDPAPVDPSPSVVPDPSQSTDPSVAPTETPTTNPTNLAADPTATTIAIPPVAFGDTDGQRDFHDGSGDDQGEKHHRPRPTVNPTPDPSATTPSFGGGSDDSGDDSGDDD